MLATRVRKHMGTYLSGPIIPWMSPTMITFRVGSALILMNTTSRQKNNYKLVGNS